MGVTPEVECSFRLRFASDRARELDILVSAVDKLEGTTERAGCLRGKAADGGFAAGWN